MFTAPGIPMIFMGQQIQGGKWSDARTLDWSRPSALQEYGSYRWFNSSAQPESVYRARLAEEDMRCTYIT